MSTAIARRWHRSSCWLCDWRSMPRTIAELARHDVEAHVNEVHVQGRPR